MLHIVRKAIAVQQIGLLTLGKSAQTFVQLTHGFFVHINLFWRLDGRIHNSFDAQKSFLTGNDFIQSDFLQGKSVCVAGHFLLILRENIPYQVGHGVADERCGIGQKLNMHLCFVPLTEDGRLSAKDIMGNKKKLTWWQDEFWKHMVKRFPDLERGESASQTGRDHILPRVFKEMTRLTKQKDKLEDLLAGINPFNAKSRAEEICKILDTYLPSVEKMDTLLRKYGVAFTKTASENKKLKTKNAELEESLASAQKVSTLKQIEDLRLRRDYDSAVAILEQIPAEVLDFYKQPHKKERETAYDR